MPDLSQFPHWKPDDLQEIYDDNDYPSTRYIARALNTLLEVCKAQQEEIEQLRRRTCSCPCSPGD